jgi:NodT family efflux transporter outer membrane factor (OMF) lipoprotein
VAANEDQAEASAADLAGVDLSLHAELANDYFALRGDDEALVVLDKTVAADQQAYNLTEQRYKGGITSEGDVDQAETQLENAKTQETEMSLQRAQLEHAIAILIGKAPADFTLPPAPIAAKLPRLHNEIPSVLLQRRPDIAAAERRTAAANAEIGVARAAWFPVFNLSGMIGMQSVATASWLNAPSEFWALGSTAAMPLFNGGLTSSLNGQARAAYEQTVANYRQTVLSAYGEAEDNLAALHHLESESQTQAKATASSERALAQANTLYKEGATTYLDVVSTQNAELQARLASITLQIRRLTASVGLIKAIGGGWQSQEKQ